jgi:hypothetical protein
MSHALRNKMMIAAQASDVPNPAGRSVLKALAYFDIFNYPLKKAEIRQFLEKPVSDARLGSILQELVADGLIFQNYDMYSLQDSPLPASKRVEGNLRAASLLPKAQRIGKFLFRFPFVRGVGVSGSLSKNYADEKADIDFFVITKANRLWIARTIMHLFKKLTFLGGREHFYCMNYFVDEEALVLSDQNIFTAIELKTLLPVSGNPAIQEFFLANGWADEWFPDCPFRQQTDKPGRYVGIKYLVEWFCNNSLGNRLDNYLQKLTDNRWKRKQNAGKRNNKGQMMGLITGKHYAKSNPGAFQEKVLEQYKERLDRLGL